MGIREMSVDAEHGLDLIPNSPIIREAYGLDDTQPDASRLAAPIVDTAIPYDAVWDCVTCGACVEACPVLIEHVDKIVGLRRNLVLEDSRFPAELTAAFTNMERAGNPWGQPQATRTDWTKGLPFAVPTVAELAADGRLAEIEVLYWVGCAAAFDERNRGSPARSRPASRTPASASRSSARRSRAPAIRPAGWATSTSSRCWPPTTSRRSTATGSRTHRHGLPALLQHDRQRVRPARRPLRGRPPLGLPAAPAGGRPAPDDRRRRHRRHAPRGR